MLESPCHDVCIGANITYAYGMETNVPYSFEDPGYMPVKRHVLSHDGSWVVIEQALQIPAAAFSPEPLSEKPETFTFEKQMDSRFGTLATQSIVRNSDKLAIHALAWGGTTENQVTAHETYRIAQALPDHTLTSLAMPGHGISNRSSRWPAAVRRQMLLSGSFSGAGEHLASLLNTHSALRTAQSVDVLGTSTGARSAISLASSLHKKVDNLVLFDPPGASKVSTKAFRYRFSVVEKAHGDAYTAASKDTQHVETMRQAPRRASLPYIKAFARRDPLAAYDFYQGEVAAMARQSLGRDLSQIRNVGRVVILSPEQSALNDIEDMSDTLSRAQRRHPNVVFEHYMFPGTHTITRMASTVLAELFKTALSQDLHR